MIEPVMYFGIGFLVAALLGLLFVPLVHNRAVRLTMRRLEAATPLSIAEIRADKDQLRAEFAMSTRRLEMSVEQMKTKTTSQLAELGKKSDAINQLKKELGEKTATIFALEARDKTLRDQLRATEEEFRIKSGSLREAERTLADKEAELVKLVAELGEQSIIADSQRIELAALRTQVEAMKVSVTDYERTVKETEQRLSRERADADGRGERADRGARQARRPRHANHRPRAAAILQTTEAEVAQSPRRRSSKRGSAIRAACWPSAIIRSNGCAANSKPRARPRPICAASWRPSGSRSSNAADKFRSDIAQLEAQLAAAIEERTKLQREIAHDEARHGIDLGGRARRERAAARAHQRRRRRSGAAHRGARGPGFADRNPCSRWKHRRRRAAALPASAAAATRRPPRTATARRRTRTRSPTASARCNRPPRASRRRIKLA